MERVELLSDALRQPSPLDDVEAAARNVLALLLRRMRSGVLDKERIPADPLTCPNCGLPFHSPTSPYCSACCKEQAAYVRQFRGALATGSIDDVERQIAKGEVLWRLLGGGLPRRVAKIPDKAKQAVFKKAEDKCQVCGAPATHIDNMGSG